MYFEEFEHHQHKHNKLVREILRQVAKDVSISHKEAMDMFRGGDYDITFLFWDLIKRRRGDEFNRVEYCYGCKKFNLFKVD